MRVSVSVPNHLAYGEGETQPSKQNGLDVLDAAYHTAHKFPGGVHALAHRMDMSSNTLMHKVSLTTTSHHLTLREAVAMQEVTGDVAVLRAMAEALGYDLVRSIPASSDNPIAINWQMVAALADMHHAVADAFHHGVTRNSLHRCNVMAAEASSAINNLLGALRASLPKPPEEVAK